MINLQKSQRVSSFMINQQKEPEGQATNARALGPKNFGGPNSFSSGVHNYIEFSILTHTRPIKEENSP